MSQAEKDTIEYIGSHEVGGVLVKGFTELYKVKPNFPIEFLGKWLQNYSKGQARFAQLESTKTEKEKRIAEFEMQQTESIMNKHKDEESHADKLKKQQVEFEEQVEKTQYLADLLVDFLPKSIEAHCSDRNQPLTGCYIGQLKHRHKALQVNNFEPNAELDTQNPKVIEFIGASPSHQWMIGQILPSETGRSYEVFKEEEPPAQDEEGKVPPPKKNYIYVNQVQRDDKLHFFRFPRLGSFASFPLKIKSCLFNEAFDKGIEDYKAYVSNKESVEKQYNEKLAESKSNYEDAKKRFEEHQVNQQDANTITQHSGLEEQMKKAEEGLEEVQGASPVIEPFKYETRSIEYVFNIDTLGRDSELREDTLAYVEQKMGFFKEKWEKREYEKLLADILLFIQEEGNNEGLVNGFMDQDKTIMASNQSTIREQYPNRQKEAEFQLSILKTGKLVRILQEGGYVNSMNAYAKYNLPKFKEIIQIVLMLLRNNKAVLNLPRSNELDHRNWITVDRLSKMLEELENYELRRESSEAVGEEYKINRLLQRLEKIDSEAVGKYNAWLCCLLYTVKQYCWTRIHCKNAKIQAHEARLKAKEEREAEIVKYDEEFEKAVEAAKAESAEAASEENPDTFSEQQFRATYSADNPRPEVLEAGELQEFLDIE